MSMFDGKNNDNLGSFDGDEEISLNFDKAQSAKMPREKSGKGRMLIAVSVVALAAVAGGYLFMSSDAPQKPLVAAKPVAQDLALEQAPPMPQVAEAGVDADTALAAAMVNTATAPAEAEKMSDISAAAGATAPAATPVLDPAADLAAAALASADAEAQKIAPAIVAPAAVTTQTTVETTKIETPAPIMPASDMRAAEAAATPVVAPVITPAPDTPTPVVKKVETTKTTETKTVTPVAEADLPPPPQEPSKQPVAAAAATPVATPVTAPAVAGTVSPGEAAIVQNGQVLTQLTAPAGAIASAQPAVDPMMPRPAIVRDVPQQYLIVKKTHSENDIDSRLTSARQALANGNDHAAAQLFTELSRDYPKDARIQMGRAVALQRIGQTDQAIAAYEDVLNANPKNLEALTNMLGLIKVQNPALAVEKLADLRETYPDNADITAQLGLAHAASGNYEDALRYLDVAEALAPGDANILYNKGVLYDKMGRTNEAAELYRQILRMSSDGVLDSGFNTEAIKRRLGAMR